MVNLQTLIVKSFILKATVLPNVNAFEVLFVDAFKQS